VQCPLSGVSDQSGHTPKFLGGLKWLSRFAGVSAAGACRRNPERAGEPKDLKLWWRREDSNLSRFTGVSAAGACRRNPERARRAEGPEALVAAGGLEPPTYGL
jgi:hypothetical protein